MTKTRTPAWHVLVCLVAFILLTSGTVSAADNWQSYSGPGFAGGSGTKESPWQIATPEQMALLAAKVNAGGEENAPYRIGYYILTNDIDLSAYEWMPIGIATFTWSTFTPVIDRSFAGVFDGNGHAISGLTYNSNTEVAVGLFGAVSGGWIMNVSLEADIDIASGNLQVGRAVGGIAGLLVNGIVENCDVHGAISGGTMTATSYSNSLISFVGGVVGQNRSGHILSTSNTATVTGASMTATANVLSFLGGIAGQSTGEIAGARNDGTVTGGTYGGPIGRSTRMAFTGGIAGNLEGGATISNSLNNAAITGVRGGDFSTVGGIAGIMSGSSLKTSINNGIVAGGDAVDVSVGGIAGYVVDRSSISDTANTGAISGGTGTVTADTGGIVGYDDSATTVQNVYNYSSVSAGTAATARTGGIVGLHAGTVTSACWNSDKSVAGGRGIGGGNGGGSATALNTDAFTSFSSFADWSLSPTAGAPGSNTWFYPAYDLSRPHLAFFFNATGQPVTSVVPSVASFLVGRDDTQVVVLFSGDDKSLIIGLDINSNPFVDGLTLTRSADTIQLQYAGGSVAGTVSGSIRYQPGGLPSSSMQAAFTAKVFPVITVGAQSQTVTQGDVLTAADPLLLPLTVLGGAAIFDTPVIDPASGLTAAVAGGTAIRFTGTAGTPDSYPVAVRGTVNGLSALALETVTIQPSDVPPIGNVRVLGINPSTATINTATAFTALTSASVSGAMLRVIWPDGSSTNVPVSASGTSLSFSLTPPMVGTALLAFTMTGTDGTTSFDSVALKIQSSGGGGGGGDNGIKILSLTPPATTVNTLTAFTVLTDKPVSDATLKVTGLDGSTKNIPVTALGRVLTFQFTPTQPGTLLLTFTMTGSDGAVSVDSVSLEVRARDSVRVFDLTPRESLVDTPTAFTATTSRSVAEAALQAIWPDGRSITVPVIVSATGSTLSFSLTPPQVGIATLIFTITESDGSISTDALSLPILSLTPRAGLIESVAVEPMPPYRVGDDLQITVTLTRSGSVIMYVDTPRGTVEPLVVTRNGMTATAHYIPNWPGTYRLIIEASDGKEIAMATVTFRATEARPVRHRGGGGGGCDAAGTGLMALALAALAIHRKK